MVRTRTYSLNLGGRLWELAEPWVMGILNVTPDSFFAGSRRQTEAEIAQRTEQILREGGRIIDVGACSTRPSSSPATEQEEMERLMAALPIVRKVAPDAMLSVDTFRASVARCCLEAFGPFIVNDISGGADPDMFPLVAREGVPYVLTYNGNAAPLLYLSERVSQLRELGQKDILIDPGFGFGKSLDENYQLMRNLGALNTLGLPLLVGVSRKSMIYRLLGTSPEEALNGTTVLHTLALQQGAAILRVHDVRAALETIRIMQEINRQS